MSTLLCCGLGAFTSCNNTFDNPTPETAAVERYVFEEQFSEDLQAMADEFRFESAIQASTSIKEFINVLDERALAEKTLDVISQIIQGLEGVNMADLSEEERAVVALSLKERFDMTDEEIQNTTTFNIVDAYKSLAKLKVEFKDGQCTVTDDAEGFTIVSTNAAGETRTLVLNFNDERDGVRFFAARIANVVPIAIQLPKSIGVTLTTPNGQVATGTINLTTAEANQPKFINFKLSGWQADATLVANVNNRQESAYFYAKHTEQRAFDMKVAFKIQDKEMARLEINDMHNPYTEEELNSEEFQSMREMGPFFSGAYDVLKAINGKSVDKIVITLNDNMVIEGKVDDVAKSLIALGNVRKLYGTKPGKEAIDRYTQELNSLVHFTVSQKNTEITANATLLTAMKNQQEGEYQPVVALRFDGETEAQAMFDRMKQTDMDNYKKIINNIRPLAMEVSETLIVARKKLEAIGGAIKDYFTN